MLTIVRAKACFFSILLGIGVVGGGGAAAPKPPAPPPLLDTLSKELERNFQALKAKADPAPYFISYNVVDEESDGLSATLGAVEDQGATRRRVLDCSVRVGSPQLDNYHELDGAHPRQTASVQLPVEDYPAPIARLAWMETDQAWRAAAERLTRIRAEAKSSRQKELAEFSAEKPAAETLSVPRYKFSASEWAPRLKKLSAEFRQFSGVLSSSISVVWRREVRTYVNTEGARLQSGRNYYRIMVQARAKGYDGNDLQTMETFEAEDPARLPKDEVLRAAVQKVGGDLVRMLRAAPADPYVGPAILSGRAAGVFFHEIFGHRVEGQRQRDQRDGQTFSSSLGKSVLPSFLSVTFDPTRHSVGQTDLNGWYAYDDEGVAARPVPVVEGGILKTFLMSRAPLEAIAHSNGHGRKQPGYEVVSRQSNLIVESTAKVSDAELRKLLIEEVKRRNKPYGLYFEQVTGGVTTTRREGVQAFKVIPLVVYRIYADGKPDEIVRGADIVGTPLSSFEKILATSDKLEVFNGYCGAESGSVPVSAASPALLVSEIEIQRKPEGKDLPPILPRPRAEGDQ